MPVFACFFPHRFVHIVVKPNIRVLQHNTGHYTQCTGRRGNCMENLNNLQFGFLRKECEGGEIRSVYDENRIEGELNLVRYSQVLLVQQRNYQPVGNVLRKYSVWLLLRNNHESVQIHRQIVQQFVE